MGVGGGGVVEVGVSRVRVGDSRVRGRGRGQGVSAINGRSSTAFAALPSPTNTGEINMLFRHFCSYGRKRQHCRHFVSKNKRLKLSPPFLLLENNDL